MRMKFLGLGGAAALLFASGSAQAISVVTGPAITQQDYTFSGTCSDCAGTGEGVLTLQGYTPGDEITTDNFISFTYTSNLLPAVVVTADEIEEAYGSLTNLPGANEVSFYAYSVDQPFYDDSYQFLFQSYSDGSWCIGDSCRISEDFGPAHVWNLAGAESGVPEPVTWAMMMAGFGLVGAQLRASRRTVIAARA